MSLAEPPLELAELGATILNTWHNTFLRVSGIILENFCRCDLYADKSIATIKAENFKQCSILNASREDHYRSQGPCWTNEGSDLSMPGLKGVLARPYRSSITAMPREMFRSASNSLQLPRFGRATQTNCQHERRNDWRARI